MMTGTGHDRVVIDFDGNIIGKQRPRFGKNKSVYTEKETKKQETDIGYVARRAMEGRKPFDFPVDIYILIRIPVPPSWSEKMRSAALLGLCLPIVRPDIDNCAKLAIDSMNKIVYRDDSLICDAQFRKRYSRTPGLHIEVSRVTV
jgi:Holliday junction resolvase RusA-like endonuclease